MYKNTKMESNSIFNKIDRNLIELMARLKNNPNAQSAKP